MKKNILTIILAMFTLGIMAQNAAEQPIAMKKRILEGVQLGSLMCYNEQNLLCLCQGKPNENVAGIATNTPYITLNKPAVNATKKDEFEALVSNINGNVNKGDFLAPGPNGQLVKGDQASSVAVALEDLKSSRILVKWLKK
jgi:hypothetical protein